jgi:FixJ family two-component response regulator
LTAWIIRKARQLGKNFPVLLLTGSIDVQADFDELKAIGVNEEDVLYKPVELTAILEKVKEKLGI